MNPVILTVQKFKKMLCKIRISSLFLHYLTSNIAYMKGLRVVAAEETSTDEKQSENSENQRFWRKNGAVTAQKTKVLNSQRWV